MNIGPGLKLLVQWTDGQENPQYEVLAITRSSGEANRFCEKNPNAAVIAEHDGLFLIASKQPITA